MNTLNWAIQGVSVFAAIWFFYGWWEEDARIAVVARPALAAACFLGLTALVSTTMYSNAVYSQWASANSKAGQIWLKERKSIIVFQSQLEKSGTLLTSEQAAALSAIVSAEPPDLERVPAELITGRSWLCMFLLYLSLNWSAWVPTLRPSADTADKKAEKDGPGNNGN